MKNVTMNINPSSGQPCLVPPPMPSQSPNSKPSNEIYTVSFSAQFDTKDKALMFAKTMLYDIQSYGD